MEAEGHTSESADGRGESRRADRGGRQAAGCLRQAEGGYPGMPAGRGCGDGNGRNQQCGRAYRQCVGGYQCVCDDCAGEGTFQGLFGNRPCDDTGRKLGRHGALQQLHFRSERMGKYL